MDVEDEEVARLVRVAPRMPPAAPFEVPLLANLRDTSAMSGKAHDFSDLFTQDRNIVAFPSAAISVLSSLVSDENDVDDQTMYTDNDVTENVRTSGPEAPNFSPLGDQGITIHGANSAGDNRSPPRKEDPE